MMELEKDAIFGIQFTSGAPPCLARTDTNFKRLYEVQVGVPVNARPDMSTFDLQEKAKAPAGSWCRVSVSGGPVLDMRIESMFPKDDFQLERFIRATRTDGIDDPNVILAAAIRLRTMSVINKDEFDRYVTESEWQGKNAVLAAEILAIVQIGIAVRMPKVWLNF